jgi:hypothetical protein
MDGLLTLLGFVGALLVMGVVATTLGIDARDTLHDDHRS